MAMQFDICQTGPTESLDALVLCAIIVEDPIARAAKVMVLDQG
jgi:hypothetical protein